MRANHDKSMISRGPCTEGAACVLVASVCSWSGDDEDRMNHQKPTTEQVRNLKKSKRLPWSYYSPPPTVLSYIAPTLRVIYDRIEAVG